jgi:NAD(P)H dehydrogenase (quinone)
MTDTLNDRLLVTGAGGHLGRKVVEELLERGAKTIVATTRDPSRLKDLAERGVDVRTADFDRPETLKAAFEGVDRLLLISTDTVDTPGARLAQHRAAIGAAEAAGVRHLVYTSLPNAHPTPESSIPDDHFWTEVTLAGSRLDWTILRNSLYAEVILMFGGHAIASGHLVTATGTAGRSYVTRDDCARTAAGALILGAGREICELTGPIAITQDELAAELGAITGRTIVHQAVTPDSLEQGLLAGGVPPFMARAVRSFDADTALGYHAIVTPTVERFSGRAPTSVIDFLRSRKSEITALAHA